MDTYDMGLDLDTLQICKEADDSLLKEFEKNA